MFSAKWIQNTIICFSLIGCLLNDFAICEENGINRKSFSVRQEAPRDKEEVPDRWFGKDKLQHFFVSAFVTSFAYFVFHEPLEQSKDKSLYLAGGFSLSVGVGKEVHDLRSKKGHPSFKDLVADLFGIGFAVLLIKSI